MTTCFQDEHDMETHCLQLRVQARTLKRRGVCYMYPTHNAARPLQSRLAETFLDKPHGPIVVKLRRGGHPAQRTQACTTRNNKLRIQYGGATRNNTRSPCLRQVALATIPLLLYFARNKHQPGLKACLINLCVVSNINMRNEIVQKTCSN